MAAEIKVPGVFGVGTGDHWGTTAGLKDTTQGKMQSTINAEVLETLNGVKDLVESLTWAQLKAKRDAGTLKPGKKYMINDYTFVDYLPYFSRNHKFNIIVEAIAVNKLSEVAKATVNTSNTTSINYRKLDAWELRYCLDNDTTRFALATSSGKGVIYWMKDEFGNEAPFDFKNVKKAYGENVSFAFGDSSDKSLDGSCHHNVIAPYYVAGKLTFNDIVIGSGSHHNTFGPDCHGVTLGENVAYKHIVNASDEAGKYQSVTAAASMAVNNATFNGQTLVSVTSSTEITAVESLNYEVVFDVAAGVSFTYPESVPVMGDVDTTKRRLYSFMSGTLVVGNFN